jgi:hypothetical protein
MKVTQRCYNCNQKIYFDNDIRNGYGMAIPLDDRGEPHGCKRKDQKTGFAETQRCFKCGESIFFDDNYMSISGKCIPLDSSSSKPHQCNLT